MFVCKLDSISTEKYTFSSRSEVNSSGKKKIQVVCDHRGNIYERDIWTAILVKIQNILGFGQFSGAKVLQGLAATYKEATKDKDLGILLNNVKNKISKTNTRYIDSAKSLDTVILYHKPNLQAFPFAFKRAGSNPCQIEANMLQSKYSKGPDGYFRLNA